MGCLRGPRSTDGTKYDPTRLRNSYFVMQWNLSEVNASGSVDRIGESIREHVHTRAKVFVSDYEDHLPAAVDLDGSPASILDNLLSVVRKTDHKLYLLIDEYDNFVNDVMASDVEVYHELFENQGPYKQLFKSVKAGTEGEGIERVLATGVSPVALNDLTSGFNNAEDLSLEPALATLCGFREDEIRDLLRPVAEL
jgi:hypothetical protein